jgi:hypothetical protein
MADTPELTPERAQKWIEWADQTDRGMVDTWLKKRPHFTEQQIRDMAAQPPEQPAPAQPPGEPAPTEQKYTRNDRVSQVLDMLRSAKMKDAAFQGALGPLEGVMNIGGVPGMVQDYATRGGKALARYAGADPEVTERVAEGLTPVKLPNRTEIEQAITPSGLPKPKGEAGRQARKITRLGTEAATLPLSWPTRLATAAGGYLGGEGGRAIGGETGEAIGEFIGSTGTITASPLKHLNPMSSIKTHAARRVKNQLSNRELLEQLNSTSVAPPWQGNSRLRNYMGQAATRTTNPDEVAETLINRDATGRLMDEVSKAVSGKSRGQLKTARQEAYKPINEGQRYLIQDPKKRKILSDWFKDKPGYQQMVNNIVKYEGKDSMDTLQKLFAKNQRGKQFPIDKSQVDRFATEVTDNIATLKPKAARVAQRQLNEFIDALGDPDIIKSRSLARTEGRVNDAEKALSIALRKPDVPETKVVEILGETTGITDPDLLHNLYTKVRQTQQELSMVNKAAKGGDITADITAVSEAIASFIAGLKQRAMYLAAGSVTKRKGRENQQKIYDEVVSALDDPDSEIWSKLRKQEAERPLRAIGQETLVKNPDVSERGQPGLLESFGY